MKFEPISLNTDDEPNQGVPIRHLHGRMNDLHNDHMRLRDNQQSKSTYQ